jgi:hypothetical protein
MNTALGTKKAGMVLLNTTSFSGVASQSINNVFTTTYDRYKITGYYLQATANSDDTFRLRVGGVDTATNYGYTNLSVTNANSIVNVFGGTSITQTGIIYSSVTNAHYTSFEMTITRPFETDRTIIQSNTFSSAWPSPGVNDQFIVGGYHNAATSFDGFSIFGTGTKTGSISVYGMNK